MSKDTASYSSELIPRILRDIDDGVFALDMRGHIMYMNPQSKALLGIDEDVLGQPYAAAFFDDPNKRENDDFHQLVLDAVYQKEKTHRGTTAFTDPHGIRRHLRITSSFLHDEDAHDRSGIVMILSDVTEAEKLRKKRSDAATVFAIIIAGLCAYLFLLNALDFFEIHLPTKALTQVINAIVCIAAIILYKKIDFSPDELGLKLCRPRATIGTALAISAAVVVCLITIKLLVLRISPTFFADGTPFWNWDLGLYSWLSYGFTCTLQEFLARSMIHGSIRRIFIGRHGLLISILLSSLLFSAVHVAHGFLYMSAAFVLMSLLGGLYEKQHNIWGVTIIHFVLGHTACCLGFLG